MDVYYKNFEAHTDTRLEREKLFSLLPIKFEKPSKYEDFKFTSKSFPIYDVWEQSKNIFIDGTAKYLGLSKDEREKIVDEVEKRYKDSNIPLPRAVRNWLNGEPPSKYSHYKKNCYNFCVAMGMDLFTTAEFMYKHFQIMPFYYKNKVDAIYFYCIKEHRGYEYIKKLLELSENFPSLNDETIKTENIGENILEISNDEEFINYLKLCCYDKQDLYKTARNHYLSLFAKCKDLSQLKTESDIYYEVAGYNDQISKDDKSVRYAGGDTPSKGISASSRAKEGIESLPGQFTENYPSNPHYKKIKDGKASWDILRKNLICFKLYEYYKSRDKAIGDKSLSDEEIIEHRNDFLKECNDLLYECGYVSLYERNLFDWIIIWTLNFDYPVAALKSVIKRMYFDAVTEKYDEDPV